MKKFLFSGFRVHVKHAVKEFFFPKLTKMVLLRMSLVVISAILLFGFVLRPCFINGESMQPAYDRSGLVFCNLLRYRYKKLQRGDVVVISYFGRRYLLKRIIALAGEEVEFRNGTVFINGEKLDEPYVRYRGNWNIKPLTVAPGHCFVVGDNRAQHPGEHVFGEVRLERIAGGLLF